MYPVYPLEEPPKLWMITQIKSLKHNPYWVKEAMKEMGLYRVSIILIIDLVTSSHKTLCNDVTKGVRL